MKIIICIGIVIMTTIISKMLAEKFITREKFFNELVEYVKEIERNLRLLKEPINKIKKREGGYVEKIVANVDNIDGLAFLSEREKQKIKAFFNSFGKSDSVLEQKRTESFASEICEILKVVENEKTKKVPLFIKLGIVFGSFIVIILV